jgi:hypothetical protein
LLILGTGRNSRDFLSATRDDDRLAVLDGVEDFRQVGL